MCGINGVYNYRDLKPVQKSLFMRMRDTLAHRGPDDRGLYVYDKAGIALGHRRLSIIDLETGHQPMSNEDGTIWLVFNGEIYNFLDLRRELLSLGHLFKTNSDTETIIHSYEEWGVNSFSRFNGMYAFALWDERNHTLTLARDPFGIKPLYYWDNGHSLIFGSEIKSILYHPKVKREVDLKALDEFLTLTFVPSPRTAFSGINKLLPGHALICNRHGNSLRYFYRKIPELLSNCSENDIVEELREKIFTAINRQMVADVPVGAMLSGGVDSYTVAEIMTRITGGPIQTFTVGFSENFADNELNAARATSSRIGSQHHEIVISADEYAELLPQSILYLEEPIATASTLAFYKVSQLASKQVKVVLTGQGADEPFAGYQRHFGERYGSLYRALPSLLRDRMIVPLVEHLPRNERLKRAVRSLNVNDPLKRMFQVYTIFDSSLKKRLYRDGLFQKFENQPCDTLQLWQADVSGLDGLSQMLYVDSRLSLADNLLIYGDKSSMAVSLEARVPFLDLELMEFVESIPSNLKIKGRTQKYIFKKAVSKWIPNEVISRKKIGFTTPVDGWFRKELRQFIEDSLLYPGSACNIFFEPKTIRSMIDNHQSGRQDYKRALFCLLTFEIWYDQFIKFNNWRIGSES